MRETVAALVKEQAATRVALNNMQQGLHTQASASSWAKPYIDALGQMPDQVAGKDRYVIEGEFQVLQAGYEAASSLRALNGTITPSKRTGEQRSMSTSKCLSFVITTTAVS
jgi:hypothetical protein